MFRFLSEIIVRSRVQRENAAQQQRFLPWEKVNRIALIISKKESLNKSALDRFIDDTKKFVEVFYVEPGSKEASFADWNCFVKKDASLLKLPKSVVADNLKKKTFDLVINTAGEDDLFSASLCASLPAVYKCGSSHRYNVVNLVIERAESRSLLDYLNDTLRYLKMIRL